MKSQHTNETKSQNAVPTTYYQFMEISVRELMIEKGKFSAPEINKQIDLMDSRSPADGATVVARAWMDPDFKKRLLEIWCLIISSFFSGYMAFYFPKMLFISYKFQERSEGADEILIWIPQSAVALGSIIFFICVFHHLINSILGKKLNNYE